MFPVDQSGKAYELATHIHNIVEFFRSSLGGERGLDRVDHSCDSERTPAHVNPESSNDTARRRRTIPSDTEVKYTN